MASRLAYGPGCESKKISCPSKYFCNKKCKLSALNRSFASSSTFSECGSLDGVSDAWTSYEMSPRVSVPTTGLCCVSWLSRRVSRRCAIEEGCVHGLRARRWYGGTCKSRSRESHRTYGVRSARSRGSGSAMPEATDRVRTICGFRRVTGRGLQRTYPIQHYHARCAGRRHSAMWDC